LGVTLLGSFKFVPSNLGLGLGQGWCYYNYSKEKSLPEGGQKDRKGQKEKEK
jgi:hypothetical protein